jgi:hypothetical protein
MNFCTGCRCKHLEPGGPGVCPWRKTDTSGKPIKYPQFNGWDPVYFATKGQHIRDIMANRASRVKDPKAKMDLPKWNLFIAEVDRDYSRGRAGGERLAGHRRRTSCLRRLCLSLGDH